MYRDNPAHHVQELLSQTMWNKHPLGRPLTGTVESIGAGVADDFDGLRRAGAIGRGQSRGGSQFRVRAA